MPPIFSTVMQRLAGNNAAPQNALPTVNPIIGPRFGGPGAMGPTMMPVRPGFGGPPVDPRLGGPMVAPEGPGMVPPQVMPPSTMPARPGMGGPMMLPPRPGGPMLPSAPIVNPQQQFMRQRMGLY